MANLRQQLPPLTALVAFEAAARRCSFTRAAQELNITQAAVSRQIRLLESNLGVSLFHRLHRSVTLTTEGERLLHTVRVALEYLADGVAQIRIQSRAARKTLITVVVSHAVASFWLLPRLWQFQAKFSALEVQVLATDQELEQLEQSFDIAIRYGAGNWPGLNARYLGTPEIVTVCSPAYFDRNPFCQPEQLVQQTLLCQDDLRWDWLDWPIWLAELGIKNKIPHHKLTFNTYPLVIQAALAGQGVALGWRYLVDDLLADGSLIQPLTLSLTSPHQFYLVTPENTIPAPEIPEIKEMCDWITAEFRI